MTPWLLCIDTDTRISDCLRLLSATFRTGCPNISFAVQSGPSTRAVGFCGYICTCCSEDFRAYWRSMPVHLEVHMRMIWVRATSDGKYLFDTRRGDLKSITEFECIIQGVGIEVAHPKRYSSIEPLFDLINKHKNDDIVVDFRLDSYAKNLRWGWLAEVLARLEKTRVKGYFINREIPY